METAGYSGTPLIDKLGIRPGMKLLLIHPPDNYADLIGEKITGQLCKKNETPDLVHLFVNTMKILDQDMKKLRPAWEKNPSMTIWVSWYKKSSGIPTDVTEDQIRRYAIHNGLVDVKVCAVSGIWSGLKLVVPLKKRS